MDGNAPRLDAYNSTYIGFSTAVLTAATKAMEGDPNALDNQLTRAGFEIERERGRFIVIIPIHGNPNCTHAEIGGTKAEIFAWLSQQPDLPPKKYFDPNLELRAASESLLTSIRERVRGELKKDSSPLC
ncbi:hypothetical protein [Rhizobium sp. Leaf391]|uniref:hypothetical protein n=1 Tax=Rhizobium sp. Leaf391 TaxID=1736360 RepID=UPI000A63D666|nr:hypothetical protein [Rhizobium sp. Leaf391]